MGHVNMEKGVFGRQALMFEMMPQDIDYYIFCGSTINVILLNCVIITTISYDKIIDNLKFFPNIITNFLHIFS